jgi:hypothetical protein
MIQDLTIENLLKSGCNTDEANRLYNTPETDVFQNNNGNFYVSKPDNIFYTDIDFYRMTCFNNGSLRFPYNCPDLVNEYFDLALTDFLVRQKTILGILFNEQKQTEIFKSIEIERTQQRIDGQKEYILKMKLYKNESKKNDIQICEAYINYLNNKIIEPQEQPEAVKLGEVKTEHPKYDPNLWNNDCFELFKYLYDCYYKTTNRQLTNVWFYLKDSGSSKYILKATKDQYKDFIFNKYQIKITNFDKAQAKWEDKEYTTINDHRINFEDTLKLIAENVKNT